MSNDETNIDFGVELDDPKVPFEISAEKEHVNSYDIFRLAQRILGVAASVYLVLALIRIFYPGHIEGTKGYNNTGIVEVWEYSKVFLNSVISLILGLYFGAKAESQKREAKNL
jgi:hypothetical protein